jgi:hypothetical protein
MKLYADSSGRRARQLAGDLLLLLWIWGWLTLAGVVRDATLELAGPGRQIEEAGTGLAGRLRDAGAGVGDLPLVGDEVSRPFEAAGGAADQLAGAGSAQVAAVESLATWLMVVVAGVPVLLALAVYLPLRWRFVREATAGRRYVDSRHDLDLFALRAMSRQPLHRIARISDDPVGDWRAGNAEVIGALAALELRDTGLTPAPAGSPARPGGTIGP